jgi:hypothetical protein
MNTGRSICVIASGHISSCPRMVKAASAFRDAGYGVRIVCAGFMPWLMDADRRILSEFGGPSSVAYFDRETHVLGYYWTGVRYRLSRRLIRVGGVKPAPLRHLGAAFSRPFSELVRLAVLAPADLYYGGTSGGIAVAAEAARRTGRPYAVDLEDFHSAEQHPSDSADLSHRIIEEIERRVLGGAKFLTCGSEAMAMAYAEKYGVKPTPISNVYPLPPSAPDFAATRGPLRVLWMGQTVGPDRGIEDAIAALGIAGSAAELTLRGTISQAYLDRLLAFAGKHAPNLKLKHVGPDMRQPVAGVAELCRGHDVGLAVEPGHVLNNALSLSNKSFVYMLAGLAVAITDTPGQHALAKDLGQGAFLFKVGDVARLAAQLKRWADDAVELEAAKRVAWDAAVRRWHWEHAEEKGRLLGLLHAALAD